MRLAEVTKTPIAMPDVPLANTKGVHPSAFRRSGVKVETDTGRTGLAEPYVATRRLTALERVAPKHEDLEPCDLRELHRHIELALLEGGEVKELTALVDHEVVDDDCGAFGIACHDIRGKEGERPQGDLLGGAARMTIPYGVPSAAMCHVAAATPNSTYQYETLYPWSTKEFIIGGRPTFVDVKLQVPMGPRPGVELNSKALAELHESHTTAMVADRDDTDEIRKYIPDYVCEVPIW